MAAWVAFVDEDCQLEKSRKPSVAGFTSAPSTAAGRTEIAALSIGLAPVHGFGIQRSTGTTSTTKGSRNQRLPRWLFIHRLPNNHTAPATTNTTAKTTERSSA